MTSEIKPNYEAESSKNLVGSSLRSCRICLMAGETSENEEFICPCKCQGSLKYVH